MIKFGPSGNSLSFYEQGHKQTIEALKWVKDLGLDLYEYSFGRGVLLSDEMAMRIGTESISNEVEITVHAPYYINFANDDVLFIEKSISYITKSLDKLLLLNGKRCIFHMGSPKKDIREVAFNRLLYNLNLLIEVISNEEKYNGLILCPEVMGKINQLGSVDEIIQVCKLSDLFIPCIDFGHLNSRTFGSLKCVDDYVNVLTQFIDNLGYERMKHFHIHFSHIEYSTKGGEIRHLTNADTVYGPYFEHLAQALISLDLHPYIISESDGKQAEDSVENMLIYKRFANE